MFRRILFISAFWFSTALTTSIVDAAKAVPQDSRSPALHTEIDRIVGSERVGPAAAICSDDEFLRRIYLDLAGKIPTTEEARRFLQDPRPDKRSLLIDTLLEDPHFDRNFMRVLDVMLMERRIEKVVSPGKFREFLRTSVEQRKPLNALVREILVADGANKDERSAARFLLDRAAEPHILTRDVGRLFLGVDMQCAQCHDHPSIDDYLQSDYYGIYAFLNRTYLFGSEKGSVVAERAEGEAAFVSVFEGGDPQSMMPHLPGGKMLDEPKMEQKQRYHVAPAEGVRPVPKFSRRELLAIELTSGKYNSFQKNIANRLWAHMFGRGIVHPLDLHHSENPPTNPDLLAALGDGLLELDFDLREFVRQIALSDTYQRSSELPEQLLDYAQKAGADRKQNEVTLQKQRQIVSELHQRLEQSTKKLTAVEESLRLLGEKRQQQEQQIGALTKEIDAKKLQLNTYESALPSLAQAVDKLEALKSQAEELCQLDPEDATLAQLTQSTANQYQLIVAEQTEANQQVRSIKADLDSQLHTKKGIVGKLVELNESHSAIDHKRKALRSARTSLENQQQEHQTRVLALEAKLHDFDCLSKLAATAKDGAGDSMAYQQAWQELAERWRNRFQCGHILPLTAEQLTWSISEALGIVEQKRRNLRKQADEQQKTAQADEKKEPPSQKELVKSLHTQVENALYDFIFNVHDHHGQPDGNYQATAKEALFLSHSKKLQDWIEEAAQRWIDESPVVSNAETVAEKLYLTILSRKPNSEEAALVRGYLVARAEEPKTALRDLIWALLSCTEFRFQS